MNAPASLDGQRLDSSAPTFAFDRDNTAIQAIRRHISDGRCCQVLGPHRHLKSRLIQVAGALLDDSNTHHVVYLDLSQVETDRQFFASIGARIHASLPLLADAALTECQSATDLQLALVRLAKADDRNLLVMVDHLEIAPPNQVALLLSALRAAHTDSMDEYYSSCFQALVCGSLLLSQLALHDADRYESISQTVMVPDLSEAESRRLLDAYLAETQRTITDDAFSVVREWVMGDALLITEAARILRQLAASSGRMVIDRNDAATAIEQMRRAVGAECPLIDESIRHISNDTRVLTVVRRLLEHKQPKSDSVDNQEMRTLLDLSGVVHRHDGGYEIKSLAWMHLLRERLGAPYIGRLFARAGEWEQAITYLGRAQGEPTDVQQDYRPELFAAIINAIHDSRDERQGFARLAEGLKAAYAKRDMLVYALDPKKRALELVTETKPDHPPVRPSISLAESERPEILACSGTEFSILLVDGAARLLYPLQSTEVRGDPIGLISADERTLTAEDFQPWPVRAGFGGSFRDQATLAGNGYRLWEEREVLLTFLRNAARAIQSKHRFHELLDEASRRAELLRVLDRIKTLLHDPDLPEETVWRVMLEGVTHGRGLGFNRAILFTPSDAGFLAVRHAVGYVRQGTAEKNWRSHPFTEKAADDWIADLVERHRKAKLPTGDLAVVLRGRSIKTEQADNLIGFGFHATEPLHSFDSSAASRPPLPEAVREGIQPAEEFILVPLRGARGPLGVLYADNKFSRQPISGERYRMLHSFAAQIALVVEGERSLVAERHLRQLEQERREQIDNDLQNLQELQRALQFNLDKSGDDSLIEVIQAELSRVCESAMGTKAWLVRVCPFDRWQIMARDEFGRDDVWMETNPPPLEDNTDAASSFLMPAHGAYNGLTAYLRAADNDLMSTPVEVNGNQQATLYVALKPHSTVANRDKVLERAANRLGVVIGQVQTVQVLQRLVDTALRLTRDEELDTTLHTIVKEAMEVLNGVSTVTLYAIDERNDVVLKAYEGVRFPERMTTRPPYSSTVVEYFVKTGNEMFVTDVREKRPFRTSGFAKREGIRSVAALPLTSEEQRLGCMFFGYRRSHLFTDIEKSALRLFARLATAELQYDRLDRELSKKTRLVQYTERAALANEVIHRLGSIVSGMSDHLNAIERAVGDNPRISKRLELLRGKGEGLAEISEDLNKRLKEGGRDVKREPQPLGPTIGEIVRKLAQEAPAHVKVEAPSGTLPDAYPLDRPLLEILIGHLIHNACDAIPTDRQGLVEVTLQEYNDWFRIGVRDNGCGILEAHRGQIFDRGFTTRRSGRERGQGLGIAQMITELHSGRLTLGPSDTEGTTFWIDLPRLLAVPAKVTNNGKAEHDVENA